MMMMDINVLTAIIGNHHHLNALEAKEARCSVTKTESVFIIGVKPSRQDLRGGGKGIGNIV